jgi:pimeloyl-ACP methyl ester carboxylesterase
VFHGAADPLRTAPLYRHLIEMLPSLGVGVFVYDRRGSGASTGPSAAGSYTVLADDGIAARNLLATRPGVDPRRIGYWGLSQGGWLAALAAQRDPSCAFAISVSAPMAPADVQMRFAVANILRIHGYDDGAIKMAVDARAAVDGFMRGEVDRATAQRLLDQAAAQPWFDLAYMSRTFRDPDKSDWAHEMRNDPLTVMKQIRTPTLVLYGSADPWVPVATSLDRLRGVQRARKNIDVRVIAGADHMMMTSIPPLTQVDPKAILEQAPEAPEYFGIVTSWLVRHGIARR